MVIAVITMVICALTIPEHRIQAALAFLSFWKRKPDVAIGVVQKPGQVLLVHRNPTDQKQLMWQFPAGTVSEGRDPRQKIVEEVLRETGVTVEVEREIGRRVHPVTRRVCAYYACRYVSGETQNGDPNENIYVRWVDTAAVQNYLGRSMYGKVLTWLAQPVR